MEKKKRNLLWLVRMFLVGLIFAVVSCVMLLIAFARFGNTGNNSLFVWLVSPICRRVLGLEVRQRGAEIVAASQPCVFVMNHQASMDILLNTELYPKRCVLITKTKLALIPIFGWLLFACGNLLVNRRKPSQSMAKMEKADEAIQVKRLSVWLFPEGTRGRGRGLGPFKKGAFHMAIKNQVPLVPVVVSSYVGKMDFARWHSGTVLVEVLPPIPTNGLTQSDVPTLLGKTHDTMRAAIAALDRELVQA